MFQSDRDDGLPFKSPWGHTKCRSESDSESQHSVKSSPGKSFRTFRQDTTPVHSPILSKYIDIYLRYNFCDITPRHGVFPAFLHNIMVSSLSTEMSLMAFLVGKSKLEDKIGVFSKPQEPIIQRTATLWQDRQSRYSATFRIVRVTKFVEDKL